MTALATLDRKALKEMSEAGASLKAINDSQLEKESRWLLYTTANNLFNTKFPSVKDEITAAAKSGACEHYIPVLDSPLQEGIWKNIRRFDNGKFRIEGTGTNYPLLISNLTRNFQFGVIRKDDKVRKFNEWDWTRGTAWMVIKKIAAALLKQHLDVTLLKAYVYVTNEYQEEIDYKTNRLEMWFLGVSWG